MNSLNAKLLLMSAGIMFGCASGTEVAPGRNPSGVSETPVNDSSPVVKEESPEPESSGPISLYTAAQSERGEDSFRETCLSCHSSSEFRGRSFQRDWRGSSLGYLYEEIVYYMPEDNPGGLSTNTYLDIMAYILDQNGFPGGEMELVSDIEAMKEVILFPRN
jgi:hypothetical protein